MIITHPIPPLFDAHSEVLILGSFPSVKSREMAFFYGHPQNRFWQVMAAILRESVPETITQKKSMMLRHHVALWDVIASCNIEGSSDSSIRDVTPNDLSVILDHARVRQVFVNGKTAEKYYIKYTQQITGIPAVCLPSTSPANASWKLERLIEKWKTTLPDL